VLIEAWRRHYNTVRPHSALGYRPPAPGPALAGVGIGGAATVRPLVMAPMSCTLKLRPDRQAAGQLID
jgi:hypothetical protein